METSSVVRYLEAYRMCAFSGLTVLYRLSWDIKAKPWLVRAKRRPGLSKRCGPLGITPAPPEPAWPARTYA
jgi:hypothetical protein